MKIYDISQWILLFFIYSFAGWIWECLYVSVAKRKWVNRGFLNGPALPIYGFGAVIILFVTMPFQSRPLLIFLSGMLGATLLEFVTGFLMEKIFGVKYWDYTGCIGSIKGYICAKATLCWGFFSLLLVKVIHRPLDKVLDILPEWLLHGIVGVCFIIFVYDVIVSVREAIDLKEFIEAQMEHNERLKQLQERLEDVHQRVDDVQDEIAKMKENFAKRWQKRRVHALRILKRNPSAGSRKHLIDFDEIKRFLEKELKK